jgi:hypothetical protein
MNEVSLKIDAQVEKYRPTGQKACEMPVSA